MSSSRVCHYKCPEKYFHKKTLTETTLKQKFEEKFKSKASLKYLRSWKCYEEVESESWTKKRTGTWTTPFENFCNFVQETNWEGWRGKKKSITISF